MTDDLASTLRPSRCPRQTWRSRDLGLRVRLNQPTIRCVTADEQAPRSWVATTL
jgi:hypothetical protein